MFKSPERAAKIFTFIAVFFIKAVWRRWKYSKLLQVILCHGHWLLLKFLWNFIKDFFYISGLSSSGAWKYKPTEQSWTGALGYPCLEEMLGILMSKEFPAWLRMTSVLNCLCPWAGQRWDLCLPLSWRVKPEWTIVYDINFSWYKDGALSIIWLKCFLFNSLFFWAAPRGLRVSSPTRSQIQGLCSGSSES